MRKFFFTGTALFLLTAAQAQNVGVNTPAPNTTLDVNGALALRSNAITLTNSDNNNIAISQYSFFRISGPTAAFAITGIASGTDGRLVTLYNATAFALTLKNLNPASAAVNQVNTLTGADVVFAAGNSSVTLQYSSTEARWILVARQGPELAKTLNQSATSVFGSSSLTMLPAGGATLVPGLTQTVSVPAGSVLYLSSVGGLSTTAVTATGFSLCDLGLLVDGSFLPNGGYQRVYAANTGGVTSGMPAYWSLSAAVTLPAGSHTIAVYALGTGTVGASTGTVSGTNTSPLQGTLTVVMLTK